MKKNMILVQAINDDGVDVVADALDLDDRSFRAFILNVLWQKGAVAGIDPQQLPTADLPMRLRPGSSHVMTVEQAQAMEAAALAQVPAPDTPPEATSGTA